MCEESLLEYCISCRCRFLANSKHVLLDAGAPAVQLFAGQCQTNGCRLSEPAGCDQLGLGVSLANVLNERPCPLNGHASHMQENPILVFQLDECKRI